MAVVTKLADAAEVAARANLCRREGRLPEAEALFREAGTLLPRSVEGLAMAEVLALWASLDRDLMRWNDALAKLDRAQKIYILNRRCRDVARCRILRAVVFDDRGYHELAQEEAAAAWEMLPERDSLRVLAAYNIVESEIGMGNAQEARAMFEALRPAARAMELEGDPLQHRRRLDWIEAQIALAEGRVLVARDVLVSIAEAYAGSLNTLNMGRVLVDLAECEDRLGHAAAFERVSVALFQLLASAGVQQGGAALKLLSVRMAHRRCSEAVLRMLVRARNSVG